jgi:hypothetical protein
MTALADTPHVTTTTTDDSPAGTPTFGSRPLAVATVAAPVALAAGVAVHPDDTHGVEHTLEAIGGDASFAWTFTHLVEPYAWALFGLALLLVLPRMAGAKGGRFLRTAAWMSWVGYTALGLMVYAHGETFRFMAATDVEPSVYAPLFDQFQTSMPLAAMPSLLGRVGLLLAVIGLIRARTVPLWVSLSLLTPVVLMGTMGFLPYWLGMALFFGPLVVGMAGLALRVARTGGPALGVRSC